MEGDDAVGVDEENGWQWRQRSMVMVESRHSSGKGRHDLHDAQSATQLAGGGGDGGEGMSM